MTAFEKANDEFVAKYKEQELMEQQQAMERLTPVNPSEVQEHRQEGFNKGAVIAILFLSMALAASCIVGLRWRRALRKERIAQKKRKLSDHEHE